MHTLPCNTTGLSLGLCEMCQICPNENNWKTQQAIICGPFKMYYKRQGWQGFGWLKRPKWGMFSFSVQNNTSPFCLFVSLLIYLVLSAALPFSPYFTISIFSHRLLDCLHQMTITCGSFETRSHQGATGAEKSPGAWAVKAKRRGAKEKMWSTLPLVVARSSVRESTCL